ncbi:MAG: glycosyltransferase [Bacilli bacterium]|jgi:dolichyl-phosphate beta-glucosyltransferase|nr:glycosyltransferase [Bacilli bacterium]MCH4210995.1 glycosyltransferase [Bacilli bacterium]MCH4228301.1 glycosyltransferase [Bacilli bacterium]MCH4277350.1 glycosyltransferase [Bacilli bacterium]MCI2054722.1 glycosyltransferase [Bacilli bacterium]
MKISVIFPVKNQTAKLLDNIKNIAIPYYDSLKGITYEFIIVSDGSNEPNQKALEEQVPSFPLQVRILPYENHSGKGHNVKKGILAATGDYVMFMDADFATDLHALDIILPQIKEHWAFLGSRHCPGSSIVGKTPFIRGMISSLSRKIIKHHFHFYGIDDTQCGYKLFETKMAKMMVKRQINDDFAFDLEYILFLKVNNLSLKEIPVIWKNDSDSSMSNPLKSAFKFYFDMFAIRRNKKAYMLTDEERKELQIEQKDEK